MVVKCGCVYLYKRIFNYNKERGFPGGSVVKNAPANAAEAADAGSISESRRRPWRREWQLTSVFSPGESPQLEEPAGLQSMGRQRVLQD